MGFISSFASAVKNASSKNSSSSGSSSNKSSGSSSSGSLDQATRDKLSAYENRIANGGTVTSTRGQETTTSTPGADYNYRYTNGGQGSTSGKSNLNYGSGGNYGNRATTFTWNTPTGTRTTSSNATNYQDAAKEAGIDLTTSRLANASSYYDNNGKATAHIDGYNGAVGGSGIWNKEGASAGYDTALAYEKALADQYNMKVAGVNVPIGTVTNTSANVAPLPGIAEILANQNSAQYGLSDSASNIANYSNVLNEKKPEQYAVPEKYNVPKYEGITADDIQSQYDDIYDTQEQAARNQLKALKQQYDYNGDQLDQTYDKNATQNYTDYMMSTKNLPQQLRALGLSGGASETSLMGVNSNYQNALNDNELARADALNKNNLAYSSDEAEYGTNMAQIYSTLQQGAMSAVMQAQQQESEYSQWVQEYQAARTDADRNYALQKARDAQDNANSLYSKAQEQTQYSETLKQQALENAYAAADMGDFSKLKSLGVNTTAAEEDYALKQKTANAQYNKLYVTSASKNSVSNASRSVSRSTSAPATPVTKHEPVTAPAINSVIDDALGDFESNSGLAYNAKYLIQKDVFTKDEYNSWAKARGKITI